MSTTISSAIASYIDTVRMARSPHTASTYSHGLNLFSETLKEHNIDPESVDVSTMPENALIWFLLTLKSYSAATERLYLTAATTFYEFLAAEDLVSVNLPRIRLLIKQRARRPGLRLPQFPADSIDILLFNMININNIPAEANERLIFFRDRAFLIVLADTGLRVHEACNLHRGDIDWNEGKAMVIGKGNRQDIVRISQRALKACKEYLQARATFDGANHKALASLSLFARHDKGTGTKTTGMTTTTGRNIVASRVQQFLGKETEGTITPHSFRHYFVTRVLKTSNNLKLAQSLARHKNIAVTQRYAHLTDRELDEGYYRAIDEQN